MLETPVSNAYNLLAATWVNNSETENYVIPFFELTITFSYEIMSKD